MFTKVEKSETLKRTAVGRDSAVQGEGMKLGTCLLDNRKDSVTQNKLKFASYAKRDSEYQNGVLSNENTYQLMSWSESKSLQSSDYNDPVAAGVSGGGVWMYVLNHKSDPYYDIRVHFHAGSSKASKTWTVRWNNEGSGNNIATQKWMRDRVNQYYDENQQ